MIKPSKRCPGAYFPTLLTSLEDQLRKGDFDKLMAAAPLFEATEEANLGAVLQSMFGAADKSALTKFNNLVSDLREQSGELNGLNLRADAKRVEPNLRTCWIEASADAVDELVSQEPPLGAYIRDDAKLIRSDAQTISSEDFDRISDPTLRFSFIYAKEDRKDAQALIERIKGSMGTPKSACIEFVDLHNVPAGFDLEDRKAEVRTCKAHIFFVSPSLDAEIKRSDLQSLTRAVRLPVSLKPINSKYQHAGVSDEDAMNLPEESFTTTKNKGRFVKVAVDNILGLTERVHAARPGLPFVRLFSPYSTECWTYVRSKARALQALPENTTDLEVGSRDGEIGEELLEKWADDQSGTRFAVVLGEFGIGKTTLLQMFTKSWNASQKEHPEKRFAIYLDLRAVIQEIRGGTVPSLETILTSCVEQSLAGTAKMADAKWILEQVREKRAILIFDGLDEQMTHLDPKLGKLFFQNLLKAIPIEKVFCEKPDPAVGRIIFSCRNHFFKDLNDQVSTFVGQERGHVKASDYHYMWLLPFDEDQIKEYLRRSLGEGGWESVWDAIESIHNLRDLAARPILLSLITGQIRQLQAIQQRLGAVLSIDVYQTLVARTLERDEGKHILNEEDKLRLMRQLALDMWKEGTREWPWEKVDKWIKEQLLDPTYHYEKGRLPQILEDLRNATFVTRENASTDRFRFAHTSIQEYFLACRMVEALKEKNPLMVWDVPNPSPETLSFVAELLSRDQQALDGLSRLLETPHQQATVSGLRVWEMANRQELPLPSPSPLDCSGLDFVQVEFSGTSGKPLIWDHSRWNGADLGSARMLHVSLSGASFDEADTEGAEFRTVSQFPTNPDLLTQVGEWTEVTSKRRHPDPMIQRSIPTPSTRGGHLGSVWFCRYHPDGETIVSASIDHTVKVWDLKTGREISTLQGHSGEVFSCHYSPDGKTIVSASADHTLKLWDAGTGREIRTLVGHEASVSSCDFCTDGKYIVSASDDGSLKIWDVQSGKEIRTLKGHNDAVTDCQFSPDGRSIVSASRDRTLKIWDANTGRLAKALTEHAEIVWACVFSSDGKNVVSASDDGSLKIWDVQLGKEIRTLKGHNDAVTACQFSPDGRSIVSASRDGTLKTWDAQTAKEIRTLRGHRGTVNSCHFSPDSQTIVSASNDETLKVWDANSGTECKTLKGHTPWVRTCSYCPDGNTLASGSDDNTLKIWDAKTCKVLTTLKGHTNGVVSCSYSPDGQNIVSASVDNTLKIWDAKTGKEIKTLKGHASSVLFCDYSPDGQYIVSTSFDNTIKIWDTKTGEETKTLRGHTSWVLSCSYSSDGRSLVSGCWDGTLRVWDVRSGTEIKQLGVIGGPVYSCQFSPDGKNIVSASNGISLSVWDVNTGKEVTALNGHTGFVWFCAYSPDGKTIVSASNDQTLKLWDAKTGGEIRTLQIHTHAVLSCAYSPNGKTIASTSPDGTLILWDATTGEPILQWGHTADDQGWTFDFRLGQFTLAELNSPDVVSLVCFDEEEGRLRAFPPPYIPQKR